MRVCSCPARGFCWVCVGHVPGKLRARGGYAAHAPLSDKRLRDKTLVRVKDGYAGETG